MPESTELSISELRKNRGASVLSSDPKDGAAEQNGNGNGNHGGNGPAFANSPRASTQARPLATRPATQARALQRPTVPDFDTAPQAEAPMSLPFDPMRIVESVLRN